MTKIYAIESPALEMGRILKNKLSPLRVNIAVPQPTLLSPSLTGLLEGIDIDELFKFD